jgi:hypothetical protein
MSDNPYKPPGTELDGRPPRPTRPGSPVKAVAIGLVVDLGGSLVLNLLLTILYWVSLQTSGMSQEELSYALSHIPSNSWVWIANVLLGAGIDVLSGFVCARIMRRDEYRVGAVLAAISALCTLQLSDAGDSVEDLTVLLTLCTAACTMLGVKYGRELNRRPDPAAE